MSQAQKNEIRKSILAHIRKQVRSANGKRANWPGAPVSHFDVTGDEPVVLREMLADGTLREITRPKADSRFTACFIAIA